MSFKWILIALVLSAVFFLVSLGKAGGTEIAANRNVLESAIVVLTKQGFEPREVWIKKGGTVIFSTNMDRPFWPASNLHPDHGIYPEFDPRRPLDPSESWQFTFNSVGNWGMHDHLRSYYIGAIHVVE